MALKRILESHAYLFLDAPFFHKDLLKPFLAAPSSSFPLKILAFKEVEKWSKKGYGEAIQINTNMHITADCQLIIYLFPKFFLLFVFHQ